MTTANSNMFYARPVFLPNSAQDVSSKSSQMKERQSQLSTQTKERRSQVSKMQDTAPPPRPPPPRPTKAKTTGLNQNPTRLKDKTDYRSLGFRPLTQSNMTSHDRYWEEDFESRNADSQDALSPPLNHITPELTEEMWKNFDPLDVIDSTSDRSDSSVDTMIMMTTEEERRNREQINQSLMEYTAIKNKGEVINTNKLKNDIQNKNLHLHIPGRNGLIGQGDRSHDPSYDLDSKESNEASKMSPLHISTGNHNSNFSPSGKTVETQGFSNADSPDDGYGTNSSSGTISSPCSSSFNSVITEFDSSYGSVKKVVLPNGAIKPNSVRESWAVRRKQRMIESEDNTVQEQLRQLTSIQEETSEQRTIGNHDIGYHDNGNVSDKNVSGYRLDTGKSRGKKLFGKYRGQNQKNQNSPSNESTFVNVTPSDIEHQHRQLYVVDGEREITGAPHSQYGVFNQAKPQVTIETSAREPESISSSRSGIRLSSSGTIGGAPVVENSQHFGDNLQECARTEYPDSYGSNYTSNSGPMTRDMPLLRGGSDTKYRTLSGRIYVSASGDEGMYSLNQSSRSTSLSSFQPISDKQQAPGSPQSPLEKLSGELLEKWTDMDRNYRNYYGFQEQAESRSRTDSKVNYFQKKKINTMYDNDNYYHSQSALPGAQSSHSPYTHGTADMQLSVPELRQFEQQHPKREHQPTENTKTPKTTKDSSGNTKSKFFQILPNMFKPSNKKQNVEVKSGSKSKQKFKTPPSPIEIVPTETQRPKSVDLEPESEYINIGDLPQYSLAQVKYEEKQKKGEKVSVESLKTRPVFASSKDITKLFSKVNMSFDSMTSPGSQRHSFHSMPMSYRQLSPYSGEFEDMRPRAQSTSATMRTRQGKPTVDTRMAVIAQKNSMAMNQGQLPREDAMSTGNISVHSGSSSHQRPGSRPHSRSRLDSGSSNGESKLSTLV